MTRMLIALCALLAAACGGAESKSETDAAPIVATADAPPLATTDAGEKTDATASSDAAPPSADAPTPLPDASEAPDAAAPSSDAPAPPDAADDMAPDGATALPDAGEVSPDAPPACPALGEVAGAGCAQAEAVTCGASEQQLTCSQIGGCLTWTVAEDCGALGLDCTPDGCVCPEHTGEDFYANPDPEVASQRAELPALVPNGLAIPAVCAFPKLGEALAAARGDELNKLPLQVLPTRAIATGAATEHPLTFGDESFPMQIPNGVTVTTDEDPDVGGAGFTEGAYTVVNHQPYNEKSEMLILLDHGGAMRGLTVQQPRPATVAAPVMIACVGPASGDLLEHVWLSGAEIVAGGIADILEQEESSARLLDKAADFSKVQPGDQLVISDAQWSGNNGVFTITAVGASTLSYANPALRAESDDSTYLVRSRPIATGILSQSCAGRMEHVTVTDFDVGMSHTGGVTGVLPSAGMVLAAATFVRTGLVVDIGALRAEGLVITDATARALTVSPSSVVELVGGVISGTQGDAAVVSGGALTMTGTKLLDNQRAALRVDGGAVTATGVEITGNLAGETESEIAAVVLDSGTLTLQGTLKANGPPEVAAGTHVLLGPAILVHGGALALDTGTLVYQNAGAGLRATGGSVTVTSTAFVENGALDACPPGAPGVAEICAPVESCHDFAVEIEGGSLLLDDTLIEQNSGGGLHLGPSAGVIQMTGGWVRQNQGLWVTNNSRRWPGILAEGGEVTLTGVGIIDNQGSGLWVRNRVTHATDVTVDGNGKGVFPSNFTPAGDGAGIVVGEGKRFCDEGAVVQCPVGGSPDGRLFLDGTSHVSNGNWQGLVVFGAMDATGATIEGNRGAGIAIETDRPVGLHGVTVADNGDPGPTSQVITAQPGVLVTGASGGLIIEDSDIGNNATDGVSLGGADVACASDHYQTRAIDATVDGNSFYENTGAGLRVNRRENAEGEVLQATTVRVMDSYVLWNDGGGMVFGRSSVASFSQNVVIDNLGAQLRFDGRNYAGGAPEARAIDFDIHGASCDATTAVSCYLEGQVGIMAEGGAHVDARSIRWMSQPAVVDQDFKGDVLVTDPAVGFCPLYDLCPVRF